MFPLQAVCILERGHCAVLEHEGQNLKKASCNWAFKELLETRGALGTGSQRQGSHNCYETHTHRFFPLDLGLPRA